MKVTLVTGTRYLDREMEIDLAPGESADVPDDRSAWSERLAAAIERGKLELEGIEKVPAAAKPRTSKSRKPLQSGDK